MSRTNLSSSGNLSESKLLRDNTYIEFTLEINDIGFDSLFDDSRTKAVAARTNCKVELTPRILNKRINLYRWAKFAIVKIMGPDEASLTQCLRLLERQFPVFLRRKEYSRRANVTIFTDEIAIPDNTALTNKLLRSASTMSCCQGLAVKSPFVNDSNRPVKKTAWKQGKSEIEGKYVGGLPFRRHTQPAISSVSSFPSNLDSKTDKLSQNEVFGLLGALAKNTQSFTYPVILPPDNVIVRVSLENEGKGSQTPYRRFKMFNTTPMDQATSIDDTKDWRIELQFANDSILMSAPSSFVTTDVHEAKSIQMPLDKVECVSESYSSGIMPIEQTTEKLLTLRTPKYEKHLGPAQIPNRPIPDRMRMPPKRSRGLYDHEGKYICDGESDQNELSERDGTSSVSVSVVVQHNKKLASDYGDSGYVPKYSGENINGRSLSEAAMLSNKSATTSSQISVSISTSHSNASDQSFHVQLSYSSESEISGASSATSSNVSIIFSSAQSKKLVPSLHDSRSTTMKSFSTGPSMKRSQVMPNKPISNLSFGVTNGTEKFPRVISAVVEIHRSTLSSEALAYMSDQQRQEMEFKKPFNQRSTSKSSDLSSLGRHDSHTISVSTTRGANGRAVSGLKVSLVQSRSSIDKPNGVYVSGMTRGQKSGVNEPFDVGNIAQSILQRLKEPVDGSLSLMFDGRSIFSSGPKTVAIHPTEGDIERSNYDFKSANYEIMAKGRPFKKSKMK